MTKKLVKNVTHKVFPQTERNNLRLIIDKMIQSDPDNARAIYVFNILYGIYQLLIRYETMCREIIFMIEIENDSEKLRTDILKLCKSTLYNELEIPCLSLEDSELLQKLSTGKS